MQLTDYRKKASDKLSGGNKRKVFKLLNKFNIFLIALCLKRINWRP